MHLYVPDACALYDAPEDGCIWHPKHVERGKCNKVTLNNLHQAGLHLPVPGNLCVLVHSFTFELTDIIFDNF